MDKQNRLTKWSEWEIGAHYEWVKLGRASGDYECVAADPRQHCVLLKGEKGFIERNFNWQNRYRKIKS
jgi:hypothetical protein